VALPKTSKHERNGTLRESTYFILLDLAFDNRQNATTKHGFAILKDVEGLSTGCERLSTSTLYKALARLLEQGWIERVDDELENAAAAGHYTRPSQFKAAAHRIKDRIQAPGAVRVA
jgi:DNA-binding PadR family transcriptional regulator